MYSPYVTCGTKKNGATNGPTRKYMTETLLQAFPEAVSLINPLGSVSIVILASHVGSNILKGNTKGVRHGVSFAKQNNGFGHESACVKTLSSDAVLYRAEAISISSFSRRHFER